jgi:hypothetical protein
MLSFGTKKKKRSWRDMADAEEEAGAPAASAGGADDSEEELDEKAIEEELGRVEKEEAAERERLGKIQAEADARRAARKAKFEEKKAAEAAEKAAASGADASAAAADEGGAAAAAAEAAAATAADDGTSITAEMCRQGRCVRVDNVNFKSTEDDIRMLFEGDAETRSSPSRTICKLRRLC